MDALKLYKFLQQHVTTLNHLAVELYNDKIAYEEASREVKEDIQTMVEAFKVMDE